METILINNKHKVINCMHYVSETEFILEIYYLENMILLSLVFFILKD